MSSENQSKRKYTIVEPLLLALMMVVGIMLGYKMNSAPNSHSLIDKIDNAGTLGRVEEIIRFIENKYVDSIDSEQMMSGVVEGILQDLDPHSIYIPPSELEDVDRQMSGKYYGIGIETLTMQDTVTISRILEGSPAALVGFKQGDKILTVNDSAVAGIDYELDKLSSLVSNATGMIRFKILERASGLPKTIKVQPAEIPVNSAEHYFKLDDDIGYIELSRFTSKSYTEFMTALEAVVNNKSLENLVIDLRNNPGGYLPEANKILSQLFPEKDRVMLYTEGRNSERREYKTNGKNFFRVNNIAVLIDEGSASGSEILAGAIQDWDRGVIIGKRSYGKGLVQEQYPLKNGGAIRLTIAKYYTPSGRLIQRPFNDRNAYYDSIDDRSENGELAEAIDSSQIFKTKKYNRTVYGGGGIKPDIIVTPTSFGFSDDYQDLYQAVRAFLFKEYLEGRLDYSKEDLLNKKVDNFKFLEAFKEESNFSQELIDTNFTQLNRDIVLLIARYNHGSTFEKQVNAQFDLMIQAAIDCFSKTDIFAELQPR